MVISLKLFYYQLSNLLLQSSEFTHSKKLIIIIKKNKSTKTFSLFVGLKKVFTESAMALAMGGF
jgi:hypothetical protein